MADAGKILVKPPERLGRTVVVGYCDVSAAGIRALAGLSCDGGSSGLREAGREELEFSGMGNPVFVGMPAVEAAHLDRGNVADGSPSVTLLKINTPLWGAVSVPVATALADLLSARLAKGDLDAVVVAAAVQRPTRAPRAPGFETGTGAKEDIDVDMGSTTPSSSTSTSNGGQQPEAGGGVYLHARSWDRSVPLPEAVKSLPKVWEGARTGDGFLTTLLRLLQLEEVPLLALICGGYRMAAPVKGNERRDDGTGQAVEALGQCLASYLGMGFDKGGQACASLEVASWPAQDAQLALPGDGDGACLTYL